LAADHNTPKRKREDEEGPKTTPSTPKEDRKEDTKKAEEVNKKEDAGKEEVRYLE